ncbi:MAG: bifunctional enoyl-CoA hydratase/phosphate acetyltransferase [Peptostreptococcaceae bacterium]|nr:bifunctional enoyl-CoA hydratase/phosphate acetyltransferase [Peptostreptococcaceae bacterium]
MIKNFDDLISKAKKKKISNVAVVAAEDESVLEAIKISQEYGFVHPILIGDRMKIDMIAKKIELTNYEVVDETRDPARKGVSIVRSKKADILMKGMINTSEYLRAVLNKEHGLRSGRLLSLLAVYEVPQYHKLIYATDSGVNVAPDLEQKKDILTNALLAMKNIGFGDPKVAILSSNEIPSEKIPSTMDAVALVDMAKKGEIPTCIIEGPIAFDVAFDKAAAIHKGIDSAIAGDVDVLLFPNIETGNVLGKSWLHFDHAKWAGIVLGAKVPIILGSRSDTPEIKVNSIALACLSADVR